MKANPHGVIDLSKCQTVKSADDKTHKKLLRCVFFTSRHSLEVTTTDETYFMYANTEKEKDEWIGAIGRYVMSILFLLVLLSTAL